MRDFGFAVTVHHSGETVVVRPSGALDLMTAPQLARALAGATGAPTVVVDLSDVDFADCAGLAPIRRAMLHGEGTSTLRVVGARSKVERVLRLTGLARPVGMA